ncbi:ATP-grasp domain-containing protein [Candidatus Nanohalobium constans]|uniref:Glutathione synthase n=1 Tax=Candidatus Nanohalobium constans TaxID=2565781 RepID=A0A5Q0UIF5_9ARCH|nr:YheC/YheD family protein [Candidatus Nanohalobium constans]QGA80669.1 glutathione synthase [Candidatus Nanohalobium constans]
MNKTVAFLWWEGEVQWENADQPFSKDWKSQDYAEYMEMLAEKDIRVVCGDYTWYRDESMQKAWHWNGEEWRKVEKVELDGVYDLFRHDKGKYELKKEMKEDVGILNDPEVAELCQDKLKTFERFEEYIPETRKASEKNVEEMIEKYGKVIVKPRYGSSGEGISVVEDVSEFEVPEDWDEMIVQKIMENLGTDELGVEGPHDLRVIVVNDEVIGSYLRIPEEGELLSNVAQGGSKKYVDLDDVPKEALSIVEEVASELDDYRPVIYTVDVMFSDGEPMIVELNSQPGIYYHGPGRKESREKPWMKKVVEAIGELAESS